MNDSTWNLDGPHSGLRFGYFPHLYNVIDNSTTGRQTHRATLRAQGVQWPASRVITTAQWPQRTTPDQAKAILISQPQIAYALVALMVKIGIIDIPIFQVSFIAFLHSPMSDSSFPANLSYVRPSAKWDASTLNLNFPSTPPGSKFAQRNTTILDPPTCRVPRWCTTYGSRWISAIVRWRVWVDPGAGGSLQRAATAATCEPDHLGGASRNTRKPTGEAAF
jgi:hypothetical protein